MELNVESLMSFLSRLDPKSRLDFAMTGPRGELYISSVSDVKVINGTPVLLDKKAE